MPRRRAVEASIQIRPRAQFRTRRANPLGAVYLALAPQANDIDASVADAIACGLSDAFQPFLSRRPALRIRTDACAPRIRRRTSHVAASLDDAGPTEGSRILPTPDGRRLLSLPFQTPDDRIPLLAGLASQFSRAIVRPPAGSILDGPAAGTDRASCRSRFDRRPLRRGSRRHRSALRRFALARHRSALKHGPIPQVRTARTGRWRRTS